MTITIDHNSKEYECEVDGYWSKYRHGSDADGNRGVWEYEYIIRDLTVECNGKEVEPDDELMGLIEDRAKNEDRDPENYAYDEAGER